MRRRVSLQMVWVELIIQQDSSRRMGTSQSTSCVYPSLLSFPWSQGERSRS